MAESRREAIECRNQEQVVALPYHLTLKCYYESCIRDDLDHIRYLNSENKVMQRIREKHQDTVIEMICRNIIFDNGRKIESLMERIENDRRSIKEISRV